MRNLLQPVLQSLWGLTKEELPELIGELESLKATAWTRLMEPAAAPDQHDELLDVKAAAERLGVSRDYLYRHHRQYAFTRRQGRKLLFSALGIDRHIKQKY
ncbi:MAG: hypothetical protein DMG54_00800 [Acidobacteria bacterium]|nr:MAG: hypothetical protein DMG54_00800 [Acidobacteriota bacterium]